MTFPSCTALKSVSIIQTYVWQSSFVSNAVEDGEHVLGGLWRGKNLQDNCEPAKREC